MKFIIFISLFIGGSFADADLGGTLEGAVVLLPYLSEAAVATNKVADAKMALSEALNNTSNCGSSGSNQALLNVAKSTENLAEVFANVTIAVKNQTNENGNLRLLSGDLSEVTDQFANTIKAMNSLSEVIRTLTDNVDTESLNGVDKLVDSLENLTKSSSDFNQVLSNLNPVYSKLLLKVGSLLTGFTNAVHRFADGFEVESEATQAAEQRCNVSTGLPKAQSDYAKVANIIYENLLLL